MSLVQIENLAKVYRSGDKDLVIFRDLALEVAAGEQVAIIGESGAGKSTLLHLISGLDKPTEGRYTTNIRILLSSPSRSFRLFEIARSGMCGSSIISCRNFRRKRT